MSIPTTKVNDPTLNALLTSGRIAFRELGSQRMLEFDSAATFFMTGNSLKILGDMIRRTIKLQIDPEGVNPIDRKFKIDPLEEYVLTKSIELLSAALTIVVAFFSCWVPEPLEPAAHRFLRAMVDHHSQHAGLARHGRCSRNASLRATSKTTRHSRSSTA
jgi:hypothetical protein